MDYALILSVLVLLAAPLLSRLVRHTPVLRSALDGFVMVTVIGLITLSLLPEALRHGGVTSFLVAVGGFSLPWLAEKVFHKSEEMTHRIIILISVLAVVVHAASDGAILAFAHAAQNGTFIATGVLLHRLGEAVTIWWLLRPVFSTRGGLTILAALAAMTVVGYFIVIFAEDWYNLPLIGYWQAFAAGSLFHIVMHPIGDHDHTPDHARMLQAHRAGTACGVMFIILLVGNHYLQNIHMIEAHPAAAAPHYDMDYLMLAATMIAPVNLLLLSAAALYRQLRYKHITEAYHALQMIAPWTILLWLGLSVLLALQPDLQNYGTVSNHMALGLWTAILALVLIQTGARNFFSVLVPKGAQHKHSHSH